MYAPGDRRLHRLERLGLLPVVPLLGVGSARTQPIWADDVADCLVRVLEAGDAAGARYELAGPEVLTHRDVARLVLRAAHRRRRLLPVPLAIARPLLRAHEALAGPTAFATWDEAQLLAATMLTATGTADAERLGVQPRRMADVLGAWLEVRDLLRAAERRLHLRGDLQQRVLAERLGHDAGPRSAGRRRRSRAAC